MNCLQFTKHLLFRQSAPFHRRLAASPQFSIRPFLIVKIRNHSNGTTSAQHQDHCPFQTLGLNRNDNPTSKDVKKAFLKLALKYHPDTHTSVSNEIKYVKSDKNTNGIVNGNNPSTLQKFIQIKSAFDQIQQYFNNNDKRGNFPSNDHIDDWFYNETGKSSHPSSINIGEINLSSKMIREMVDVTNRTGQSGLDKGGMWELARSLSKKVKDKELVLNDNDPLAIEAPTSKRRQRTRTR